jgi:hypothetical protein
MKLEFLSRSEVIRRRGDDVQNTARRAVSAPHGGQGGHPGDFPGERLRRERSCTAAGGPTAQTLVTEDFPRAVHQRGSATVDRALHARRIGKLQAPACSNQGMATTIDAPSGINGSRRAPRTRLGAKDEGEMSNVRESMRQGSCPCASPLVRAARLLKNGGPNNVRAAGFLRTRFRWGPDCRGS